MMEDGIAAGFAFTVCTFALYKLLYGPDSPRRRGQWLLENGVRGRIGKVRARTLPSGKRPREESSGVPLNHATEPIATHPID